MENTEKECSQNAQEKLKIITEYVSRYSSGPKQRDDEWVNMRKYTIGGSEMSAIAGKNPFMSLYDMIGRKIGISHFQGNIRTNWGTLFEYLIQKYVEYDIDTQISGDNIFINDVIPDVSYSPDGLGVVNIDVNNNSSELSIDNIAENPKIALFEFKCPYNRLLKPTIPDYYLPQILAGLHVIDIAEIGIYVEAMFRRCRWKDLNNSPEYSRKYTPKDLKRTIYDPISYGFILFRLSPDFPEYIDKISEEYAKYSVEVADFRSFPGKPFYMFDAPDFGEIDQELFEYIMDLFDKKVIIPVYSDIIVADEKNNADYQLSNLITREMEFGNVICGILPWKLLRIEYNYVEKIPGYVDQYREKIGEIIGIVRKCLENPSKKMSIFTGYFYPRSSE